MKKMINFIFFVLLFNSCATTSTYKKKVLTSMAVAGSLGAIYGQSKPQQKRANSVLYASLLSALTGAFFLHILDKEDKSKELEEKIKNLKIQIEKKEEPFKESSFFTKKRNLPEMLEGVIRLGGYELFEKNKWSQIDEKTLVFEQYVLRLKDSEILLNNQ